MMVCFLMFFEDSISAGAGDGLSSEAAAKAGLVVPDFCLFPAFHRGMVTTFGGELRSTRCKVFRARLGTARMIPPCARAPDCVCKHGVFFELTFGRPV